ncbi:MAG: agmatinase [Clostridia bacterium]|nr:agmatinase [Clostridia bacterium]
MIKDNKPHIHEGIFSSYADSRIVVFGIPYDGTASYRPGTRFGPQSIRQELGGIETYSPYQDMNLANHRISDMGDMPLHFGNIAAVLEEMKRETAEFLKDGKKTVVLGGEHLISLPVIDAYIEAYPGLSVVHLDAHADLRDEYLGEKLSHATVMRRVFEKLEGEMWQFGIRSGAKDEFAFADANTRMTKFDLSGIDAVRDTAGDSPIYLSIDIDVLDPSILPGTGTPEAGGITFKELISGLLTLKGLNIVGADIVELSPHYDQSGVSTSVACKVLREVLLLLA